jgi:hypothetical protein
MTNLFVTEALTAIAAAPIKPITWWNVAPYVDPEGILDTDEYQRVLNIVCDELDIGHILFDED